MTKQQLVERIQNRDFNLPGVQVIADQIQWAWENWSDDVIKSYPGVSWEGEKPEDYTDEFIQEWVWYSL